MEVIGYRHDPADLTGGKGPRYPSVRLRGPQSPYGRFVGETNLASVRSRTVTLRMSIQYVGYYLSYKFHRLDEFFL